MKQSSAKGLTHVAATSILVAVLTACAGTPGEESSPRPDGRDPAATAGFDTVHVAPPTGEKETDRANIQATFDAVRPGSTVQLAPGTYLLGAGARLTVPDVTVIGHPEGTILRGCDPEAFAPDGPEEMEIVFGCTGLYVQAERQTIRGLTFEYTWHGIVVGPYPTTQEEAAVYGERGELPAAYPAGGQRVEGNTFRASQNGLRVLGTGEELSVVRNNDFVDVFHAIGIYGAPLHFLDNRVTVAEPERVPFKGYPGSAIIVSPRQTDCTGHVIAGNQIEGYPDAIYVVVNRGGVCRGVEIRENTIRVRRVNVPEAWVGATPTYGDATMVGVPITLMNRMEPVPGVLEDVLVRGNRIIAAEGLGILVRNASRNRIEGNAITGIERREPYPGINWGFPPTWEAANGSGIWLSPGSDHNEVVGNVFEDVASHEVVVEGDSNLVRTGQTADSVIDLGRGNEILSAGSEAVPEPAEVVAEPRAADQGSIAVLPFTDMSPGKDQEYFSDGFSEELWEIFGQLPELRVAYRTSAFAFKGEEVGLDSIARALSVRHLLKGSVSRDGDDVRITVQLIDASTADHLWSETYEPELRDLFQIENEIAREVVNQLQLELGGGRAGAVLAEEETKDPEAHLLLLRGRRLLRQFTPEGVEQAEPLLKQAIARDPAYARAHAELAAVYRNQAEQGLGPVETLMGQARAALDRALELDPGLARAHYQEGWIAYGSGNWQAAEASLARAVELNPGYAPAHAFRAILLAVLGRTEEAITAADLAAALDPLSIARKTDVTAAYIYACHYERAAEAARSALVLDPDRVSAWGDLAFVYALSGRNAEAIAAGERARELAPQDQWVLTSVGYAYARADKRTEAESTLRTLEALPDANPYLRAILYAGIGEKDEVFPLLDQAVAEKNALVAGLGVDPVFDAYRSDPRMRRVLEGLDLPVERR